MFYWLTLRHQIEVQVEMVITVLSVILDINRYFHCEQSGKADRTFYLTENSKDKYSK